MSRQWGLIDTPTDSNPVLVNPSENFTDYPDYNLIIPKHQSMRICRQPIFSPRAGPGFNKKSLCVLITFFASSTYEKGRNDRRRNLMNPQVEVQHTPVIDTGEIQLRSKFPLELIKKHRRHGVMMCNKHSNTSNLNQMIGECEILACISPPDCRGAALESQ